MKLQGLNGTTIRYAVRVARRLEAGELEMRSMVQAALGAPDADPAILRTLGERFDGSGPDRLRGELIPLTARILAVTAAFQALLPWGRDREDALTYIKRRSGAQLDPEVVDAFLRIVREDTVASLGYATTAGELSPSAA